MDVIKMLQSTLTVQSTDLDPKDREKYLIQAFDVEFTSLSDVVLVQAQAKHDAQIFDTICQNIKNDLGALDARIKELRRYKQEGKALYAKCAMSFK